MRGETIACVAGLLINLPRKTMRYLRPAPASQNNADGPLKIARIGAFVKAHLAGPVASFETNPSSFAGSA